MEIKNLKDNRKANKRMRKLMKRDRKGKLSPKEKVELDDLDQDIDKYETRFMNFE